MTDILLIAESPDVRNAMRRLLARSHFVTRVAATGGDGLKKISRKRPLLVLVEASMPSISGFRICELIRRTDRLLPVILLSPHAPEDACIRALMIGADDCISLASSGKILLARISRTVARESHFSEDEGYIAIGSASIDLESLTVYSNGRVSHLTGTERDILRVLLNRQGAFVSYADLISALRGHGFACSTGLLYTHIYNLRQKLGSAGSALVCDRRVGYCLRPTSFRRCSRDG